MWTLNAELSDQDAAATRELEEPDEPEGEPLVAAPLVDESLDVPLADEPLEDESEDVVEEPPESLAESLDLASDLAADEAAPCLAASRLSVR
jgi:hypothetical protein